MQICSLLFIFIKSLSGLFNVFFFFFLVMSHYFGKCPYFFKGGWALSPILIFFGGTLQAHLSHCCYQCDKYHILSLYSFNSLPVSGEFHRLLLIFANSLDPDQARHNVRLFIMSGLN